MVQSTGPLTDNAVARWTSVVAVKFIDSTMQVIADDCALYYSPA